MFFVNLSASIRSIWADLMGCLKKLWLDWENSTFTEALADKLAYIVAPAMGVSVEDVQKNIKEDFAYERGGNARAIRPDRRRHGRAKEKQSRTPGSRRWT